LLFTVILYVAAAVCLAVSFVKDRQKTRQALVKAWKSFERILPSILGILLLIGLLLAMLSPETISAVVGSESGVLGMAAASLAGSITLIPGFVAFPLAAALLSSGAGVMQIAVFISTLMMVGVATVPLEIQVMGRKATVARNALAFVFSYAVAFVIGAVMG